MEALAVAPENFLRPKGRRPLARKAQPPDITRQPLFACKWEKDQISYTVRLEFFGMEGTMKEERRTINRRAKQEAGSQEAVGAQDYHRKEFTERAKFDTGRHWGHLTCEALKTNPRCC